MVRTAVRKGTLGVSVDVSCPGLSASLLLISVFVIGVGVGGEVR